MAVYLPKYKGSDGSVKSSKVYWMEFRFQGQEVRESTGTRSITLAKRIMDKRRRELEEGAAGLRQRPKPKLFFVAAQDYLELKKTTLAQSSLKIEKGNLELHLIPIFGRMLLCDIEAQDITRYQQARIAEGAAPASGSVLHLSNHPFLMVFSLIYLWWLGF